MYELRLVLKSEGNVCHRRINEKGKCDAIFPNIHLRVGPSNRNRATQEQRKTLVDWGGN